MEIWCRKFLKNGSQRSVNCFQTEHDIWVKQTVPVLLHKAVAEVSKIVSYGKNWLVGVSVMERID